MSADIARLVGEWQQMWNGDPSLATNLIHPEFQVHGAMVTGVEISGPDSLAEWIAQFRAPFSTLTFTIDVGPIAQDDFVAVRWIADGTYAGGFPGASAEPGTPVAFTGTDLLRTADGKISEYWVNADLNILMAALQVAVL
ncbi:ester cyclase [Nocardia sp. CA-107356]|uniref:ester cyclase n=1 Tax=Nocardia sp. CA-107356 TaxID=3239972 RepID=UPI003D8FE80A